jgi:hypothetical protein
LSHKELWEIEKKISTRRSTGVGVTVGVATFASTNMVANNVFEPHKMSWRSGGKWYMIATAVTVETVVIVVAAGDMLVA